MESVAESRLLHFHFLGVNSHVVLEQLVIVEAVQRGDHFIPQRFELSVVLGEDRLPGVFAELAVDFGTQGLDFAFVRGGREAYCVFNFSATRNVYSLASVRKVHNAFSCC